MHIDNSFEVDENRNVDIIKGTEGVFVLWVYVIAHAWFNDVIQEVCLKVK